MRSHRGSSLMRALLLGALTSAALGAQTTERKPLGIKVAWGLLPSGLVAMKGGMYDEGRGEGTSAGLPSPGVMELNTGATLWLQAGTRRSPKDYVVIELYGMALERSYTSLDDWVSTQFPPEKMKNGPWFDFKETRVAGFRAFEAVARGWSEHGSQRHFMIELDVKRHLYALILSDISYRSASQRGRLDELTQDVNQFVKDVKFTLGAGTLPPPAPAPSAPAAPAPVAAAPTASPAPGTSPAPTDTPNPGAPAPAATDASATGQSAPSAAVDALDAKVQELKASTNTVKKTANDLKKALGGLFKKKP